MEIACHNPKNKEMFARYKRCVSTLHRVLKERLFTPHEIRVQCFDINFICVPRLATLKEVYLYNRAIELRRVRATFANTIFKIPIHVNDIEGYVTWLLNDHYDKL